MKTAIRYPVSPASLAAGLLALASCAAPMHPPTPAINTKSTSYSLDVVPRRPQSVDNPSGTVPVQGLTRYLPTTNDALVMTVRDQNGVVDSPNVLVGRWPIESNSDANAIIEFDNQSVDELPTFDLWRGYAIYAGGPRPRYGPIGRTRRLVAAASAGASRTQGEAITPAAPGVNPLRVLFLADREHEAVVSFGNDPLQRFTVSIQDASSSTGVLTTVILAPCEYTELVYVQVEGKVVAQLTPPRTIGDPNNPMPAAIAQAYDHAIDRLKNSPFKGDSVLPCPR